MSLEDNKALVKKFWVAFSESRLDDALAMLADDATWWIGGELAISGKYAKPDFVKLVSGIVPEFPKGIQVTPTVLTAEDNRVAMEAVSYGERSNGRIYNNFYHFQHEIRDGKLVAVREYLDTDHAYRILLAE
jgi:ketosteroid isomerase-like protein